MNSREIKLGVVGLDGHGPIFAGEINGGAAKTVNAKVVTALPVPSVMISEKQLKENSEKTAALGVRIVDTPDDLAAGVDGILILHDDGAEHLELVKLFADKGKPIFVDKPLEASYAKAKKLLETGEKNQCPIFSASSLRFSRELQKTLKNESGGRILSALTWSPYRLKPTMPGWIYYGIHAVEPLFRILGPGCESVQCIPGRYGPVIIGTWRDGRTGIAKGTSEGFHGYGFTVWRENINETRDIDVNHIYPELLKKVMEFFRTGISPVPIAESLEVTAFMEAANESMRNAGKPEKINRET
ncbi:MAG: Gfo/Idh/MocA family oxidoreductase [Victivallaceae bacterium]|nr:Gfo/Idh/MocA family oxidoreductase [Victivallaceae bacterium]